MNGIILCSMVAYLIYFIGRIPIIVIYFFGYDELDDTIAFPFTELFLQLSILIF